MVAHIFHHANTKYAENFGDKKDLAIPPRKKLLILTCMDARILPSVAFGVAEGDAHIVRNAGGVAVEAIRSIVISQRLLGTRSIAVIHHTDCGMLTFTTPELRERIINEAPGDETVAETVNAIDFYEFSNLEESVKSDVAFLHNHPLVLKDTPIAGYIYDVTTGKLKHLV